MLNYNNSHKKASSNGLIKKASSKVILIGSSVAVAVTIFTGALGINAVLKDNDLEPTITSEATISSDAIAFENKSIESSIRKEIGNGILTKEALNNVKKFSLSTDNNITEISKMPNIEDLEINKVTKTETFDVASQLKKVKSLTISESNIKITDWSFLLKYSQLENLCIENCDISYLNDLSSIPNLKHLTFRDCDFSNVNLENVKGNNVKSLELDNCIGLNDMSITNYYPNMIHLNLKGLNINNMESFLPGKLNSITMNSVKIESLKGIEKLPELELVAILDCYNLTDATALINCPKLKSISFGSNDLVDYYPWITKDMANFIKTKGIPMANTKLSTVVDTSVAMNSKENLAIVPFQSSELKTIFQDKYGSLTKAKLSSIRNIALHNMESINSFNDFTNFKNLSSLYLENISYIGDCSPLTNLEKLNTLTLSDCMVSDFSFLSKMEMTNGKLSINDTNITNKDLAYLNGLKINRLDIRDANNFNLSELTNLPNINSLDLVNTGLRDISFLKNFPTIKSLVVHSNQITDLTPLTLLPNLSNLDISHNNTISFEALPKLKNLKKLISENNQLWVTEDSLAYIKQKGIETNITDEDLYIKKAMIEISNQIIPNKNIPDKEKISRIVVYVLEKMQYDASAINPRGAKLDEYDSNSLKYFLSGSGVCSTYAVAVSTLCTLNGIETNYIEGYTIPSTKKEYGYIKMSNEDRHAWNMIKVGDEYYYLDATWMDTIYNKTGIKILGIGEYYLLGENVMNKDHYPIGVGVTNINKNRGAFVRFVCQNIEYIIPLSILISINSALGISIGVMAKKREREYIADFRKTMSYKPYRPSEYAEEEPKQMV